MSKFAVILSVLLFGFNSQSDDQLSGSRYFFINEPNLSISSSLQSTLRRNHLRGNEMINLISWNQIDQAPPAPPQKYNRDQQFGTWLDYENDNSCLSVRGLLLQERSRKPISVYPDNTCAVKTGSWFDPYTNKLLTNAQDVQLDHMVPLKQAYISGGFNWAWKYRCAYFNYRGNNYHLVPIFSETNNVKTDSRPDQWLPPSRPYACYYIANWLKIKLIWKLMISEAEAKGLSSLMRSLNCDTRIFSMSVAELIQQRAEIEREATLCPKSPPPPKPRLFGQ